MLTRCLKYTHQQLIITIIIRILLLLVVVLVLYTHIRHTCILLPQLMNNDTKVTIVITVE